MHVTNYARIYCLHIELNIHIVVIQIDGLRRYDMYANRPHPIFQTL